jgi:hypothetical protein
MSPEYARVVANLKKMRARFEARSKDRRLTEDLLRMAYGSWASRVPRMPGEPRGKDKRMVVPDLLGFLLRSFSYLYRTEPVRVAEDEAAQEIFSRKLWTYDDGLSATMTLADQLARVAGTVLLVATWTPAPDGRESSRTPDSDGYQTEVITSDAFEVLPSADPRYPLAVVAKVGAGWMYWDDEYAVRLTAKWEPVTEMVPDEAEGGAVPSWGIPHGYGRPPVVAVQNVPRWGDTYAPRMGGDDLYQSILNLGAQIRELGWTAMLQRGQPYMTGDKKEQLVLAPDAVVQVSQGGSFGVAANNANLDGMTAALRSILDLFAVSLGLPSRTFRIERASAVSGVAIMLDQQELEADRQSRAVIFGGAERRLARLVSAMEAALGVTLPPEVRTSYRQPDPIISFDERLRRVQWLWEASLIAPADAVAELYPNATPQEIMGRLERARAAALAGEYTLLGVGGRTPTSGGGVRLGESGSDDDDSANADGE